MDMKKICRNQVELAKAYKWVLGEKLGYDPGDDAIHEWINDHAEEYRERYNRTYESTLRKVKDLVATKLQDIQGVSIPDDKVMDVVKAISDTFTEVWVKEVAIDEQNNQHLDEI